MFAWISSLAICLTIIYIIDRIWKVTAVWHFFHQQLPPEPHRLPALSLIQPITASPNNLREALTIRAQYHYPGELEQILVLDEKDGASQALCKTLMTQFPDWQPKLILAHSSSGTALKTAKQLAGLQAASGEVVCFIDDDILLRAETLSILVRQLQPGVGATFGVACYTNWRSAWGGLMSAFVNANALLNYIPLTYLTEPYTITGHIYAIKRVDFDAAGGLEKMDERLDDDHELARRVTRAGLRNRQTCAIYNVDNELPTLRTFLDQMKRWFIFPRELMLPGIRPRQQISTLVSTLPNILPGLVFLFTVAAGLDAKQGGFFIRTYVPMAACLVAFFAVYVWCERRILKEKTPLWGWFLLVLAALVLPFQIVFLCFSDNTIIWRGQRMRVRRDGHYENLPMLPGERKQDGQTGDEVHAKSASDNDLYIQYHQFMAAYPIQEAALGAQHWRWVDSRQGNQTIILLPGFMGEAETAFLYFLGLASHRRVISISYTQSAGQVETVCDGLCALMDHLGIQQSTILGGSSSGFIAQAFLRRHPTRVSHMILTHTGLPSPKRARTARIYLGLLRAIPYPVVQQLMQLSVFAYFPHRTASNAFWRGHFRDVIRRQSLESLRHRFALMDDFHNHYRFKDGAICGKTISDLPSWTGKILIMEMQHDHLTTPAEQAAMRSLYPGAQVFAFSDAAHFDSVEHPEEQIRVILNFLLEEV